MLFFAKHIFIDWHIGNGLKSKMPKRQNPIGKRNIRRMKDWKKRNIYCCLLIWVCEIKRNRVGCLAKRRKWQQTHKKQQQQQPKKNWQLLFGLWPRRRLNLIAFRDTFHYFRCAVSKRVAVIAILLSCLPLVFVCVVLILCAVFIHISPPKLFLVSFRCLSVLDLMSVCFELISIYMKARKKKTIRIEE